MVRESGNLKLIKDVIRLTEEGKVERALIQFRKLLLFTGKFSRNELREIYKIGELFKSEKIKPYSEKFLEEIDKKIEKKEHENLDFIKSEIIINLGDDKKSLEFLEKVMKKYPDNAEFLNNRAQIHDRIGNYEDALKDINKAIEKDPDNPVILGTRVQIYDNMGNYEDALKDINKVLEKDPEHPDYLTARAQIHNNMGNYEDALKDINKVLEKDANTPVRLTTRAQIQGSIDNYEEALKDINKALEKKPEHPDCLTTRAQVLAHMKRFDKALSDINKAINIKTEPVYLANKIFILIDAGRLEDAKNTLLGVPWRFRGDKSIIAAEASLEFSERMKEKESVSKEIDEKNRLLEEKLKDTQRQIEENKIKIVEFLGIFAGIIAFIVSGITIMKDHSLFESLILMFGLALSLILFVLVIDVIVLSRFYDGERKTGSNIAKKKYLFLRVIIATLLSLIIIAGLIEHPDIASEFCDILRVVLSLLMSKMP